MKKGLTLGPRASRIAPTRARYRFVRIAPGRTKRVERLRGEGLEMATGPASADDPKKRDPAPAGAWTRAGLLALLFIAVNVWTTHHLGWGLENPFGLAGFSAGVGLFVALLEKWVSANGGLKIGLTAIPIWLVVLLYLICGIFAITRSSVLVLNEPYRPASRPPRLLRAGSEQEIQSRKSDDGLVR